MKSYPLPEDFDTEEVLNRYRGDTSAIQELELMLERECFDGYGTFVHSERCTRIRHALEVISGATRHE